MSETSKTGNKFDELKMDKLVKDLPQPQNLKGKKRVNFQTVFRKRKKVGRNEKCPCGSGKKYKNCCLDKN